MDVIQHYEGNGDQGALSGEGGNSLRLEYVDWIKRAVEGRSGVLSLDRILVAMTKEALYLLSEPNADEIHDSSSQIGSSAASFRNRKRRHYKVD